MAPNIPDHYLWLGLGVFTFVAIQHVAHGLRTIRALTSVSRPPPQPAGSYPLTSSDAIKTSSLLTLTQSHNVEISLSATKLLCERFYASASARQLLLRDLGSGRKTVQRRAQLGFRVMRDHGVYRERALSFGYGGVEPGGAWDDVELLPAVPRGGLREVVEGEVEEERDARRRRREAVVIHDGEGRIGEGDVWMRDREGLLSLDMEVGDLVVDGVVH